MNYNSKFCALFQIDDKYLFNEILKYLQPQPEDRILEIGCGKGYLVKKLESYSKNIIGIDLNSEAISRGVSSNLRVMDATKMDFPSESFDKIYSSHTLEHIPDLNKLFKEIDRVLKPGGKVVLIYPWEPIRGMSAVFFSFLLSGHPFACRKIHVHKLNPQKIEKIIEGSQLHHVKSFFSFNIFSPFFFLSVFSLLFFNRAFQYFTILEKRK